MKTFDNRRSLAVRSGGAVSAVAAGLLLLAACGAGGTTSSASAPASTTGTTVTVSHAGGMNVLATSSGRTLYSSAQEKGMVLCTSGACNAVWKPLTIPAGHHPTGPSGVAGGLTTMKRPNGTQQVSFDGRPLYTFSFDQSSGQDTGNGQQDSFNGTAFTWHAVTPTGGSTPAQASPSSSGSSGYGY